MKELMGTGGLEPNPFDGKPRTDKEKVPHFLFGKVATRMGAEGLEPNAFDRKPRTDKEKILHAF